MKKGMFHSKPSVGYGKWFGGSTKALGFMLLVVFFASSSLWAKMDTTWDWTATEISTNAIFVFDESVKNVSISGLITIKSGGSLTLSLAEGITHDVTIKLKKSAEIKGFFRLSATSSMLTIHGNKRHRIILDGGCDYGVEYDEKGFLSSGDKLQRRTTDGRKLTEGGVIQNQKGGSSEFLVERLAS